MSSIEQLVRQFNETYKLELPEKPRVPSKDECILINDLIREEVNETEDELAAIHDCKGELHKLAKELTDILYVTAQRMVTLGLPVDALLREVQRSNMSKLDVDGKPIFRHDGKVLKGPNYSPADIPKVLKEAGYTP